MDTKTKTGAAPEITGTVRLCLDNGRLNPDAVGWSRQPLHVCNLRGRLFRKKRYEYWCVMGERFLFSPTIANIDYAAFGNAYFLDYASKRVADATALRLFDRGFPMPDTVAGDVVFAKRGFRLAFVDTSFGRRIEFDADSVSGLPMTARLDIRRPASHETLNVLVPWNDRTFQFTSKQNTLAATGFVRWGSEEFTFAPEETWAVLDFGRGIWPYRTRWNWSAFSGRCGTRTVGVNMGAKWTDGTGANENGICIDGKLHKLHEDVIFEYTPPDFMRPWRIHTRNTDAIDLEFVPFHEKRSRANLGILSASTVQCFGRFKGVLRAGGETFTVADFRGWAEEVAMRW